MSLPQKFVEERVFKHQIQVAQGEFLLAYGVIRAIETKGLLWQLSFLKGLPLGQCVGQTLLWWHYQFRYSLVTYWEPSRKCQHSNYVLPSNQQQGQENVKICHDGQNRPHFFQKFVLKKTGSCNTDWLPRLVGYWMTKLYNLSLQIYLHQACQSLKRSEGSLCYDEWAQGGH